MRKKMKTIASLLVLLALFGSLLAACGTKDEADGETGGAAGNPGEASTEPITFTLFSADPSPNWNNMQDAVGKAITAKTGVTLDAEFAVGDPKQKIALIASSGQYPDLISPKGDGGLLVEAGALIDLRPLIEEHAPNIKKVIGEYMPRLQWSKDDDSIYFIPTYNAVNHQAFDAGGPFALQHRVVKEAGYPEIKTVEDFENAIKNYLKKHPTDENGNPNIGLSLTADDWRIMISVTNPAFQATGAPDDGEYYIDPKTYEATFHYKRPEEREYFRWLNRMNAEGILDPESFVQKDDQYKAKVATGRVLGLIDQQWGFADGENALKAAGKFDQTYGHYPVQLTTETKDRSFQQTGFMAGWGIGITTSNPDPVRAIKFLDFLASDEGQVLINWGIENEHYKMENGKRVIPPEIQERKNNDNAAFTKESGIGLYSNYTVRYGDGVKDSTGNYYTTSFPEQVIAGYSDVEKETLARYNAKTWKDLYPKEDEFPVKPWGAAWNISKPQNSELPIIEQQVQDIVRKRIPEAILAKPDQFDQIYDTMLAELEKVNSSKAEEMMTQLVKDTVELWSE
ncbi:ABC transporter substrate-binding protein [Paenibacillus sp. 32O-W]|uniref:ABC transporter substrate-binding protein n=1 Tax=Paenibacillus sp. 32O-W TaxID=1695218 RepID=UPI000720628F|nr:ABC transporter substrate-binding protein [Paenibacillus sp. 32O-W]ALS26667.1 ABC transporter substrate-binding protein [Paenibacillus sp. 32O-W]